MTNNIDVQKCLNGYLLVIGVHKILITDDSFDKLKSCVLECDGEAEPEGPVIKKKPKKINRSSKKWALKFDRCVKCGTTETKHASKGFCWSCYKRPGKNKKNVEVDNMATSSAGKKYH